MNNMKKAIIDPRQSVLMIIGYTTKGDPITQVIPNSARVAEVADAEFPVADPLFWVDCGDTVVADRWYYDMVQAKCFVVPAPPPASDQPIVVGAQTL